MADQEQDDVLELFSAPIAGGTTHKLNPTLATGGDVSRTFHILPNNLGVVYTAKQEENEVNGLYIASILDGPVLKLNGALVKGGSVTPSGVNVSSDSQAVVYRADQERDEKFELFITFEGLDMYLPLVVSGE